MADQLVEPRFGGRAVALVVHIGSVGRTWWLPVDQDTEPHGGPWCCRSHDQVQVAGVEAVGDPPLGLVEHDRLPLDRPVTGKGPMIEPQPLGGSVEATPVQDCLTGRRKVLGASIPGIGFRRPEASISCGNFRALGID